MNTPVAMPDGLWDELRWRTLRREKLTTWVFAQDVCRLLARLVPEEAAALTLAELAVALGKPESLVLRRVTLLRERGLMEPDSFRLCFYQRPQPPVQAAPEPAYQPHQPRPLYPSDRNRSGKNGYQRGSFGQGDLLRNDSANDSAPHSAETPQATPQTPVAESSLARDVVVVSESESKTTTNNSNNMGEGVQRERESEADAAAFAASFVEPGNEAAALVERLRSQGVLRHVAEELVRDCPAEVIWNQITWLRERETAGSVKNLAGMLVDSIRGNWDPPPSVVRRQEAREKRERAEAERRHESEAAAERAAEADALWERMSPAAKTRIESELRARLPSPLDRFAAKDPEHRSVREWIDTERRARLRKEADSGQPPAG